jgi:hypothetical protein
MDEFILKYKPKESFFIKFAVIFELQDLKVNFHSIFKHQDLARLNQIQTILQEKTFIII